MSRRRRNLPRDRMNVSRSDWSALLDYVPSSGAIGDFVGVVAAQRGRSIKLLEHDLPLEAPSGVWVQLPDVDYVVAAAGLSAGHRRLVVCHEIAHMLLNHRPRPLNGSLFSGRLNFPVLTRSLTREVAPSFLSRCGYDDDDEADAELLATLLAARLADRAAAAAQISAHAQDNVSMRLR